MSNATDYRQAAKIANDAGKCANCGAHELAGRSATGVYLCNECLIDEDQFADELEELDPQ